MEKKKDKDAIKQFQGLLKEYSDIKFYDDEIDKEALGKYRKATSQEIGMLSQLFGCLPSTVTGYTKDVMMNKAFNEAVKGTFRIVIPEGMHLANSRTTPGALKTLLLSAENRSKGPADAFVNDAVLNLSKVPDFVNAAFSLASFITGQYFMSQINDKILDLHRDINKVLAFLEDDKISEIYAAVEELTDLISKLSYVRESNEKIVIAVNRTRALQETARKNIYFYERRIKRALSEMKENKGNEEAVDSKRDNIHNYLSFCVTCLDLYCQAKMVEVGVLPMSIEEVGIYKQDINDAVEKFTNLIEAAQKTIIECTNDSIDIRKAKDRKEKNGNVAASLVYRVLWRDADTAMQMMTEALDYERINEEKRKEVLTDNELKMKEKEAVRDFIASYVNKLDDWIAMRTEPIEVVYSEGEYYIKAPIAETVNPNQLEVALQEN